MRVDRWDGLIVSAALEHPAPWPDWPRRLKAQMLAESNGRPGAMSDRGAIGLMQLTDKTAASVAELLNIGRWNRLCPWDSLLLGAAYMTRVLAPRFDDRARDVEELWRLCVLAYNTGPTRVNRAMVYIRNIEMGIRTHALWIKAGRPDGWFRTADGVLPIIEAWLGRSGYERPFEPKDYLANVERLGESNRSLLTIGALEI